MRLSAVQPLNLMTLEVPPQHDSDSMIPPQQHHAPHSYIPFMKAPSSIGTIPPTGSSGGQPGSQSGAESASLGTSRSSGGDLALFSMAGLKDWELDLDALEVRHFRMLLCIHNITSSTWGIGGPLSCRSIERRIICCYMTCPHLAPS